jgi:hypothetical protein
LNKNFVETHSILEATTLFSLKWKKHNVCLGVSKIKYVNWSSLSTSQNKLEYFAF